MRAEISYDLVTTDDITFMEGTYRLPGGDWQVFIVPHPDPSVGSHCVEPQRWESGVTGVLVILPGDRILNALTIEEILGTWLGVHEWVRVRGPDSIVLR